MLKQLDGQQKQEVALRESDDNIAGMNSRLLILEEELRENQASMDKVSGVVSWSPFLHMATYSALVSYIF